MHDIAALKNESIVGAFSLGQKLRRFIPRSRAGSSRGQIMSSGYAISTCCSLSIGLAQDKSCVL